MPWIAHPGVPTKPGLTPDRWQPSARARLR